MSVGGGVYPTGGDDGSDTESVLIGRISLGIIAAFVAGAVGFYWWTNSIQGGG
jgi:hypothetical protein